MQISGKGAPKAAEVQGLRESPSPAAAQKPLVAPDAPTTPAEGASAGVRANGKPAMVRAQAFSKPPEELVELLTAEIDRAFTFTKNLMRSITFFGGARIKPTDPSFLEGKLWGESTLLANVEAMAPGTLAKAAASGLFSADAIEAARGAALGVAFGRHGPAVLGQLLAASGSATGLAAGLAALEGRGGADKHPLMALTRTGAGPGMMEAVPIGYLEAKKKILELVPELAVRGHELYTQGSRIQLPFEQETSSYIEVLQHFCHFLPRRLALTEQAAGFVVFRGGFGTLNELFEAWRLDRPVLLHEKEFWSPLVSALDAGWRARRLATVAELGRVDVADGVAEGLPRLIAKVEGAPEIQKPSGERAAAMVTDLARALDDLSRLKSAVTIVGGEGLPKDAPELEVAKAVAGHLAREGEEVRIGTEGAILEVVGESARRAGGRSQAMLLDEGQLADKARAVADKTELLGSAAVHKIMLYENAHAMIALPGGVRTLDEVFEVACLMQCKKIPERPLVLVGKAFWQPVLDAIEQTMLIPGRETIAAEDLKLFKVVDTVAEARAALRDL